MENIEPFKLELFFAKHEFTAKHLMGCSDAETMPMQDLIAMADSEAKMLWNNLNLGYTETNGLPALRNSIAKCLYPDLSGENIVCFCGAEEGIYTCFNAMLTTNDHCIVFTPCYQSLLSVVKTRCDVTSIDLIESTSWGLNLEALKLSLRPNTKMIIINFPHNPTGTMITRDEFNSLIEFANANHIIIFADEVYRGLEIDPVFELPPMASCYRNSFSLGVLSKTLGLAGLRIGWLCCQNIELLAHCSALKLYLSICNSAPSEILALIAVQNYETIRQKNRLIMMNNMNLIENFLKRWNHLFEWIKPKGGCCGLMKFKGTNFHKDNDEKSHSNDQQGMNLNMLSERLINDFQILIVPGDNFPSTNIDISQYFRFGFGRSNFPNDLLALENALLQLGYQQIE
jgi:aspartate/methionine/tyrosine aminotransferase